MKRYTGWLSSAGSGSAAAMAARAAGTSTALHRRGGGAMVHSNTGLQRGRQRAQGSWHARRPTARQARMRSRWPPATSRPPHGASRHPPCKRLLPEPVLLLLQWQLLHSRHLHAGRRQKPNSVARVGPPGAARGVQRQETSGQSVRRQRAAGSRRRQAAGTALAPLSMRLHSALSVSTTDQLRCTSPADRLPEHSHACSVLGGERGEGDGGARREQVAPLHQVAGAWILDLHCVAHGCRGRGLERLLRERAERSGQRG